MMKTLFTICFTLVLGAAFAQQNCASGCCGGKTGVKPFDAKDAAFLAQANEMMMASEGKGGDCCKAEAKVVHKAMKGTHKLYVAGKYETFCCPKMAGEARAKYAAKGLKVGKVQKISHK